MLHDFRCLYHIIVLDYPVLEELIPFLLEEVNLAQLILSRVAFLLFLLLKEDT